MADPSISTLRHCHGTFRRALVLENPDASLDTYLSSLGIVVDRIDDARVVEHERVLAAYGLDAVLPTGTDHDEILTLFARDKKALDGLTFVLDGPHGLEVVDGLGPDPLRAALAKM